jgi:hypothetical protein
MFLGGERDPSVGMAPQFAIILCLGTKDAGRNSVSRFPQQMGRWDRLALSEGRISKENSKQTPGGMVAASLRSICKHGGANHTRPALVLPGGMEVALV